MASTNIHTIFTINNNTEVREAAFVWEKEKLSLRMTIGAAQVAVNEEVLKVPAV